jgi:hypothetical protein
MSRKEKQNQMLAIIEQWQQSGMSQTLYSQTHGIKLCTLKYWINKSRQLKTGHQDFIQLSNPVGSGLCLRYPNGVELLLPLQTPVSMLKGLIGF